MLLIAWANPPRAGHSPRSASVSKATSAPNRSSSETLWASRKTISHAGRSSESVSEGRRSSAVVSAAESPAAISSRPLAT